jgi:hypothetical protein
MNDIATTNSVQQAYQNRWGKDVKANVVLIENASDGGKWVSVSTFYSGGKEMEEVCYVDSRGSVRVFETTPDLVRFLAGSHSWERRFLSTSVVGAAAFLLTLAAVIMLTFLQIENHPGVDGLMGLLALAAGFYFGNQAQRN